MIIIITAHQFLRFDETYHLPGTYLPHPIREFLKNCLEQCLECGEPSLNISDDGGDGGDVGGDSFLTIIL